MGTGLQLELASQCSYPSLVNLAFSDSSEEGHVRVLADGCRLPFADASFQVVYSNSVIEHLGSWENQEDFAKECRRVGVSYYVQTPNRHFFFEPHLLTPFIHWLPHRFQARLLRHFTVWGLITKPTPEYCEALLDELRLLGSRELGPALS